MQNCFFFSFNFGMKNNLNMFEILWDFEFNQIIFISPEPFQSGSPLVHCQETEDKLSL